MDDEATASMIDIAFALEGNTLPREHRRSLAATLIAEQAWLAGLRHAWLHRVNVVAGNGALALLSGRSHVMLRVARERADAAASLAGTTLSIGGHTLRLGAPRVRELLPHATLYSHLVSAGDGDEVDFLRSIADELSALGVSCRSICGRRQVTEGGTLTGFGLMLDGLSRGAALHILETGLGAERRIGCGLFVPHRSAAAVGS